MMQSCNGLCCWNVALLLGHTWCLEGPCLVQQLPQAALVAVLQHQLHLPTADRSNRSDQNRSNQIRTDRRASQYSSTSCTSQLQTDQNRSDQTKSDQNRSARIAVLQQQLHLPAAENRLKGMQPHVSGCSSALIKKLSVGAA
jgi:hypothetical protein